MILSLESNDYITICTRTLDKGTRSFMSQSCNPGAGNLLMNGNQQALFYKPMIFTVKPVGCLLLHII